MIPFFSTAPMHEALRQEILDYLAAFYDSNWYILGEPVQAFEADYARWNGVRHCIGVANGLDALHIALRALRVGPGDEVIVPSNTYIASWLAVTMAGATPVPAEPDPRTWNIDPEKAAAAITSRTKAIMPVHLYGQACAMDALVAIARQHDLRVVEDNAQAHGARCGGRLTGSFGQINATSFYPTKNLGALGDAGAISTDDAALAEFARTFRNYGSRVKYYNEMPGVNSRLDAAQAGILQIKLRRLDDWNQERNLLAQIYREGLREVSALALPEVAAGCTHVWHLFVVLAERRDALQAHLLERGIQTMIHYPVPPHLQKAYGGAGFREGQFPLAENMARTCLSLPLYPGMRTEQVEKVCEEIRLFY